MKHIFKKGLGRIVTTSKEKKREVYIPPQSTEYKISSLMHTKAKETSDSECMGEEKELRWIQNASYNPIGFKGHKRRAPNRKMHDLQNVIDAQQIFWDKKKVENTHKIFQNQIKLESNLMKPTVRNTDVPARGFDSDFTEIFNRKQSQRKNIMQKSFLSIKNSKEIVESNMTGIQYKKPQKISTNVFSISSRIEQNATSPLLHQVKSFSLLPNQKSKGSVFRTRSQTSKSKIESSINITKILDGFKEDGEKEIRQTANGSLKTLKKPAKSGAFSDVIRVYKNNQKDVLLKNLHQLKNFELQRRSNAQRSGIVESINSRKIIGEKDRMRVMEFLTSKWIAEMAFKTEHRDAGGNKILSTQAIQFIQDTIQEQLGDHQGRKSLRYKFYKYFDDPFFLKFSKNEAINKIYRKHFPENDPLKVLFDFRTASRTLHEKTRLIETNSESNKSPVLDPNNKTSMFEIISNKMVQQIESEEISGNLEFELISRIIAKMKNASWRINNYFLVKINKLKRLQALTNKMINTKEFTGVSMENIYKFKLLTTQQLPVFQTTSLFDAIKASNFKTFSSIIEKDNILKFSIDSEYRTLLHKAIFKSNQEFILSILQYKLPINSLDKKGKSPLFYALKRRGKTIIIALMLNRGDLDDSSVSNIQKEMKNLGILELYEFLKKCHFVLRLLKNSLKWKIWNKLTHYARNQLLGHKKETNEADY